jgi:hypothetical protein
VDVGEPGLTAWEVNRALPIDRVDITFHQSERLIEPGGGGCATGAAAAAVEPCLPVTGPYDEVNRIQLWRDADAFFEQEVASGAQRIIAVNFTGYTEDAAATFHWRAVAVEYDDWASAETSPGWSAIQACDDLESDTLQAGIDSLSDGDEPFLAATVQESTVYIVETWKASEDGDGLPDTESGLPPADAVRMLMAWLQDQVRHL